MTEHVAYEIGVAPEPGELCELRESVGWDRAEADYPAAFSGYASCVTARSGDGRLVGWCAVLSDRVRHGMLLDVIVHPDWQRKRIGRTIVGRAVAQLADWGVEIVHVDFLPENAEFYRRCGFRSSKAGILELAAASGR